jgi:uncharacterized protein YqgC (DUF456 family)
VTQTYIELAVTIGVALLMTLGLLGVFIPIIPDLLLVWIGALAYGLILGWGRFGPWLFAGITLLGLIGIAAEVWVSGWGARRGGASTWSTIGGLVIGLVALIVLGPLGFLIGLLGSIFGLEWLRHRNTEQAAQATIGTGVGYGASFVVKLLLALGMILLWIIWVVV